MAASDSSDPRPPDGTSDRAGEHGPAEPLDADALQRRVAEEIKRCERHGTSLAVMLLVVDNLQELARDHGAELSERTLSYIAGTLDGELRAFDRIGRPSDTELMIVLPGADGTRAEMVARRVLDRVSTIKIEADGARRTLLFSLGLAQWHGESDAQDLLVEARAAARGEGRAAGSDPVHSSPPPLGQEPR
ncbi:MAG TPA: diguanylate cyclase [Solirubrobacteraceae bacterium]|jgi:diguanylate cyclase (GGDEF)-like protein|nr:diguanylate cyclase [Solirubrobacteraceae bacterium]